MEADSYHTHSEEETRSIGKFFAEKISPGEIITLAGDLGAGKTEFVRGVCAYFSVHDIVSSPTFTIMNQYIGTNPDDSEIALFHIDLYRIQDAKELLEIGFSECMSDEQVIKFVEWPEKAGSTMPPIDWKVTIKTVAENEEERIINIEYLGNNR
ncbi:MAG: tRNA (adenosine(37)-N6)-threonylcarbamoyltransferase complex ATPase subunit type 1 TsaE [Candidatus Kapaibacteriota bacterium]